VHSVKWRVTLQGQEYDVYEDMNQQASIVLISSMKNGLRKHSYVRSSHYD